MTKRSIAVIGFLLSFLFVFTAFGYAELTDTLFIEGSANVEYKPVLDLYISDIQLVSGAGNVEYAKIHPTTVSTKLTVTSNTTVTYKVTFTNNTDITYWYKGQKYESAVGSNSLIGMTNGITVTTKDLQNDTYGSFNTDDWIPPHTERVIYVTYSYSYLARGSIENLINFEFGLNMDAIHDQFLVVLNDKNSPYGYQFLSDAFDDQYREDGTTVLGNVGEDEAIFDSIFGSNLTINVDGEDVPVTIMVRRENVDDKATGDSYSPSGPTGCEYTVYITVDPLNSPTGEAIVYAVSYTCGPDGIWRQLGQLYEGTANRSDYDGNSGEYIGAFDVYSWEATPNTYEAADGISYKVGQEQGDQYDKLKTLEQLMSTSDQDIFNDIDNCRIFKTVYDIVYNNANASKPGYEDLRRAFDAAAPYYTIMNNGQEIKVKRSNITRSEIIPYLEAIQKALDYYNEVN